MERSEILASMGELKLFGMKAAYDEYVTSESKKLVHTEGGKAANVSLRPGDIVSVPERLF